MRTALIALGTIALGLVAAAALVDWRAPLPPIAPSVEQICADTILRAAPDHSWVTLHREEKIRGREIATVTLGELPFHNGRLVRVAGVLHAEFELVGLYPSRAAMEEGWRAPWVTLGSLWPGEPYWRTKGPSISDRCVVVEGTYSNGAVGDSEMFTLAKNAKVSRSACSCHRGRVDMFTIRLCRNHGRRSREVAKLRI